MPEPKLFGWRPNPRAVDSVLSQLRHPLMGPAASAIRGTGAGTTALLWKHVEELVGEFPVRTQAIGDCVSQGAATVVDVVKAVEITDGDGDETWRAETASEVIYGLSRVEVGRGELGQEDGSYGAWGAQAVKEYGTLVRERYGQHNLSSYSGELAREWGVDGLPDELEPTAREPLIREISLVTTYSDVRDALANGYAVTIASMQGFRHHRDEDGFLKPDGEWPHQMAVIGMDDEFKRPGVLVMNSWGTNWVTGPTRHDQPPGSFWVDAEVLEDSILSEEDSWAFGNYEGWPARSLDLRII